MKDIKDLISDAHKSADKAIKKAQKSDRWAKLNDWLNETITIKRLYFAVVYFALFGFIAYEVIIF